LRAPRRITLAAWSEVVRASFWSNSSDNALASCRPTAVELRTMLVLIPPGWTQVTVTGWPLMTISSRSASVKPRTANFAAL